MTQKTTVEKACDAVGLGDDVRLFARRARFAGWPEAKIRQELEKPGIKDRFAQAVEAGVAAELALRVDIYMRDALREGPRALALMRVDELAKLVEPALRPEATTYNPFRDGGRLVFGPTGVGKSVAGIAALRRMHGLKPANMNDLWDLDEPGRVCAWVRAFSLPNARLESGFGEGEAQLVSGAIKADFLVLDDLGWESKRAGADDVVTEVIAARYDAGRITYATTGLTSAKFIDRYGSAVARRIVESGGLKGKAVDLWSEVVR